MWCIGSMHWFNALIESTMLFLYSQCNKISQFHSHRPKKNRSHNQSDGSNRLDVIICGWQRVWRIYYFLMIVSVHTYPHIKYAYKANQFRKMKINCFWIKKNRLMSSNMDTDQRHYKIESKNRRLNSTNNTSEEKKNLIIYINNRWNPQNEYFYDYHHHSPSSMHIAHSQSNQNHKWIYLRLTMFSLN